MKIYVNKGRQTVPVGGEVSPKPDQVGREIVMTMVRRNILEKWEWGLE